MNVNEKCEKTQTELGFNDDGLLVGIKQYCKASDIQRQRK